MKRTAKPTVFIRKSDQRAVFSSIYLREAVFRKATTTADVKAGILPRRSSGGR